MLFVLNFADSTRFSKMLKYSNHNSGATQSKLSAGKPELVRYRHYSDHSLLPSCCTGQHFNHDSSAVFSGESGSFALWMVRCQTVAEREWQFQT